jgi:hypothetical protein
VAHRFRSDLHCLVLLLNLNNTIVLPDRTRRRVEDLNAVIVILFFHRSRIVCLFLHGLIAVDLLLDKFRS